MESILEMLKSDTFIIIYAIIGIIILIGITINFIRISNLNKRYKEFMKKLGDGKNIEEDLETYMYRVEKVEKQNNEILSMCKYFERDISGCIQKIGIIRYNAFKDTGSNLSFALAMLNQDNTGIVLNGIYSREGSNIYAKPVEKGNSTYVLSEEEKQAIEQAIKTNDQNLGK